jgi:hypothetical protein
LFDNLENAKKLNYFIYKTSIIFKCFCETCKAIMSNIPTYSDLLNENQELKDKLEAALSNLEKLENYATNSKIWGDGIFSDFIKAKNDLGKSQDKLKASRDELKASRDELNAI